MRYISPRLEVGPQFSETGDFKILFLNTNIYKIGIANLGWQVITKYLLEAYPAVSVRVEYADTIQTADIKLSDYNLVALHVPFEQNYMTAIWMLHQIGFPAFSEDRNSSYPLVVAGGIYNPLPLSKFIDVFVLGDGRLPMVKLINLYFTLGKENRNRINVLKAIFELDIQGFFIPSLHDDQQQILAMPELPLNTHPIHTIWSGEDNSYNLSPDYLSIMVALGCNMRCPFCLVSHCQGLSKSKKDVTIGLKQIIDILNWRREFIPVKTVKLFFASSITQNGLKEELRTLIREKVDTLVGSLSCKQLDEELVILLKQSGLDRITIAPETNQEQRWKINKAYISDEQIFKIINWLNKHKLSLNFYLMYGLPGETDQDIIKVGKLVKKVRQTLKPGLEMEVHCNQVFLKPHTPWQYASQILPQESIRRFDLLGQQFTGENIKIKHLDNYAMILQCLLSRGDQRLDKLLADIFLSRPLNVEQLLKRVEKITPNWQDYFLERSQSEIQWSQFVYNDHSLLFKKWLNFKEKLK